MHGERTRQWNSDDSLERQVRGALLRADVFENHWLDETEQGEFLPQMQETIPGQYDAAGHGIDIFAIDQMGALWIIEVSRGRKYGAIVA